MCIYIHHNDEYLTKYTLFVFECLFPHVLKIRKWKSLHFHFNYNKLTKLKNTSYRQYQYKTSNKNSMVFDAFLSAKPAQSLSSEVSFFSLWLQLDLYNTPFTFFGLILLTSFHLIIWSVPHQQKRQTSSGGQPQRSSYFNILHVCKLHLIICN